MRIIFTGKLSVDKIFCCRDNKIISIENYNKCKICHIDKYGDNGSKSITCLTTDRLCNGKNLNDINFEGRIRELSREHKLKRIVNEKGLI